MRQSRWMQFGVAALIAASAVACGPFAKLRKDLKRLDRDCMIRGEVHGATPDGGKVYVAAIRVTTPDLVEIIDVTQLDAGQMGFAFLLPKSNDYWVAVFQDTNGDQVFQAGEPFWVYGAPGPVPIAADGTSAMLDVQLSTAPPKVAPEMLAAVRHARGGRGFVSLKTGDSIPIAVGEIAKDLDAPRFSKQNGTLGLWQPVTFLTQLGVGVYFLEPYDPKRVPVLFVYGAGGSPQDFRHFFSKLDTTKYQAWFFLYPSGMRLDESSRVLGRVVDDLHGKLGFPRLDVVAHSMGGLVARRFLLDALAANAPWAHNFVTLSTPWSGHPAAALGVEYAPAVIPSWRDMETGSPFTTALFASRLAPPMTYCLGFTFHGKRKIGLPQDNDGAVGVPSELRPEAQDEAIHMRGFDLTHTGVLQSDAAFDFIQNCLAREAESN